MNEILDMMKARDPGEFEFHQAVEEVLESVKPVLDRNPHYRSAAVLERITEPERVVTFRIPWLDDQGDVKVNRGFVVEMNSAIGPYSGGLRLHPSVNQSILKFLAFVKRLKNIQRGRIQAYAEKYPGTTTYTEADYTLNFNPLWGHRADCAFPCATQNEINENDAYKLINNNVRYTDFAKGGI